MTDICLNIISLISGGVIVDSVPSDIGDSRRLDYEQNVQDAIAILPQLQTGIDVNVRFTGVSFHRWVDVFLLGSIIVKHYICLKLLTQNISFGRFLILNTPKSVSYSIY